MGAAKSTFISSARHDEMMDELYKILTRRSAGRSRDDFRLRGMWRVDYRLRPNEWERDLAFTMIYAQTLWQGCCYVNYQAGDVDDAHLGQDVREIRTSDVATQIALLDAGYASLPSSPARQYEYGGSAPEKAMERGRIVVGEAVRLMGGTVRGARVVQIGVMGNFVHQLAELGADVVGSDFDPAIVGHAVAGVPVSHGSETLNLIKTADLAIATGMTLSTGTLADIIDTAQQSGTKLVLFAATGSHLGEEYCRTFGVDVVLSEPQPQYMFQGESTILVHSKDFRE